MSGRSGRYAEGDSKPEVNVSLQIITRQLFFFSHFSVWQNVVFVFRGVMSQGNCGECVEGGTHTTHPPLAPPHLPFTLNNCVCGVCMCSINIILNM